MKIIETSLPGVLIIEPKIFYDARGHFLESWHRDRYQKLGIPTDFVQDNVSISTRGVLRGLHFQNPHAQGKLVSVLQGSVFDVTVDIRDGSPHYGQWIGITLSVENRRQLYVPPGFAHGFCVTSDYASVLYKCTDYYNPSAEMVLLWDDPGIDIVWPVSDPILSDKDRNGRRLRDIQRNFLPAYEEST